MRGEAHLVVDGHADNLTESVGALGETGVVHREDTAALAAWGKVEVRGSDESRLKTEEMK